MAEIICVINQKGGVGKTTTAHNMAVVLAEKGNNVLLIDLDSQHDLTNIFMSKLPKEAKGSYELFYGWEKALAHKVAENLYLVPASNKLVKLDSELANEKNKLFRLKDALRNAKENVDGYIIFDCPPALGLISLNALTAADKVIIPTIADQFGLNSVAELLKTIESVKKNTNPDLVIGGVLFTRYYGRYSVAFKFANEIRAWSKEHGVPVYNTAISMAVCVSESQGYNKSVTEYDPYSKPARDYRHLVMEVQNATEESK